MLSLLVVGALGAVLLSEEAGEEVSLVEVAGAEVDDEEDDVSLLVDDFALLEELSLESEGEELALSELLDEFFVLSAELFELDGLLLLPSLLLVLDPSLWFELPELAELESPDAGEDDESSAKAFETGRSRG